MRSFPSWRHRISLCLLTILLVVFVSTQLLQAATFLISNSHNVDGRAGNDTVELITGSNTVQIKITSSAAGNHNETYIYYGSAVSENVYIENLDGKNGKEIIFLYTDPSGNRKLSIINRSKDYYPTTIQPERWEYTVPVISQGLITDYDSTRPISVNNLVVTELSGFAGKELIGVGGTGNRHLFIIRYTVPHGSNNLKVDEYKFPGSVENQILIQNLDGYQGDEVVGFYSSGSSKRLYIVNNQLEYDGYSRNYSKQLDFPFGESIQSPHIQVADSVAHFTTQNVVISNLGTEPGSEIVGLYRDSSSRLGLFRINYPKSNGYVGSDTYMPLSGVYTGLYDRLDDARYTIGSLGSDGGRNGKEVYGYYNSSSSNLGGAFLYWDNFQSNDFFPNIDNPDDNGNYSDGFHNLTSSGQSVGSAIFTRIDLDGDGHHDEDDICPTYYGWIDADQDGTCAPRDECENNADITSEGVCGCSTANQDGDPWLDCVDQCDNNPLKQFPGNCGCDYQDEDSDGDGTLDCDDGCPNNGMKQEPGICGCDTFDTDSDGDGTPDCNDGCPLDETTTDPADCVANGCLYDPYKLDPGVCGCGVPDDDSDNDGTFDCNDDCPYDSTKTSPGTCGCNNSDDCLSQSATETTTFYHPDPTGTPLAISDSEGEVIWQATYMPFGEEYSVDGVLENNRRFVGKEKDKETGLTYFGSRYLLEDRFLATDPVRIVNVGTEAINPTILADPQRLNLYVYGLNNPYRYVDPDGEFALVATFAIIGTAAALLTTNPDVANAPAVGQATQRSNGAAGIVTDGAVAVGTGYVGGKIFGKIASKFGSKGINQAHNAADGIKLNKSLASQAQMSEAGTIMAGPGGRVPFRDAGRVAKEYGGSASHWAKKTSTSYTARDGAKFETHWVENVKTGQRVEHKTKLTGSD